MGIKNLKVQSRVLRMKLLWKYNLDDQQLWRKVIRAKYEEQNSWVTSPYGVSIWKSTRALWSEFKSNNKMEIGNGEKTDFGRMNSWRQGAWKFYSLIYMLWSNITTRP